LLPNRYRDHVGPLGRVDRMPDGGVRSSLRLKLSFTGCRPPITWNIMRLYTPTRNGTGELLDRAPPADIEAERGLLRYALTDHGTLLRALEWLTADHFHDPAHRAIISAAAEIQTDPTAVLDVQSIYRALARSMDRTDAAIVLADILKQEGPVGSADDYSRRIRDMRAKRLLIRVHESGLRHVHDHDMTAADAVDDARRAIEDAASELAGSRDDARAIVSRLSTVERQSLDWLWPGRFALGKFALLVGDPGDGKSLTAIDMAARVTRGDRWPCSADHAPQGRVLLIACEDDPGDTIRPRLEAAGADLTMIDLLQRVEFVDPSTAERRERLPNLEVDVGRLDELLAGGNFRLVIVDTVAGHLGRVDGNSNVDVRSRLLPLADLAARHRVAIVGVEHLNKNASTSARYRVNGSIAFVGVARSVLAIGRDPNDSDLRLLAGVKTNLGPPPPTLGFRVRVVDDSPHVEWLAEPVDTTADQMMAPPKPATPRDAAADWLESFLAAGPQPSTLVIEAAGRAGHSERTVRRAQRDLGIEPRKATTGHWEWELPTWSE
jgi:hypothetical protein